MTPPVNTQQDFVSLRLRLQEAYDQLSNLPVGEVHRPKKFKTLQSITDGLKTLERLKAGFTVITVPQPSNDQEKRVLDLVKMWGTKMRAARKADWEQLPKEEQDKLSVADTIRMEAEAETAYGAAQDILEKLEDYTEPLLDKEV